MPLFVAYQTSELTDLNSQTLIHAHRVEEVREGNRRIQELSDASALIHYLPIHDAFTPGDDEVVVRDQDEILYIDEDHLSYAGALRVKDRIKDAVSALVQ